MRYAVNETGIQAMNAMASSIRQAVEQMQCLTSMIRGMADGYQNALGPHKTSLEQAFEEIDECMRQALNPVNCVAEKLTEVSEAYAEIIDNDRLKGSNDVQSELSNSSPHGANAGGGTVPLLTTCQTIEKAVMDGKNVTIFDHPFDGTANIICNQGSAYPSGPQQTCGCCASGTIINKAGGNTNEHEIVAYAYDHKLCSPEGFTSPKSWIGILEGSGIKSTNCGGSSLESLAEKVENGQGVIIGISACTYAPQMYGHYFPGKADGHAVVLESVIRDASTGKILEYVISDSNATDAASACRRVPQKILEKAFKRRGNLAVVTDEIIW